jgi:hypothetical protein
MGNMPGTCSRAERYCDRANECLRIVASSQTPGTGATYLQLAEYYLLLASSEKKKAQNQIGNRRSTEPPVLAMLDA